MLKKIFLTLFILSFSLAVFAATPTQQLTKLLSNFQAMQADFTQVVNSKQTNKGTMAIQRPGKFRWQVESPNKQVIIADGKNIWVYDVDLEQAVKQKMNAQYSVNPAMLLSGSVTELQKYFSVVKLNKTPGLWFEMKPKQQNAMFQSIQMQFVDGQLKSMLVNDNLGNKSVITFSNAIINPQLNPNLFKFTAPKGVDVIEN